MLRFDTFAVLVTVVGTFFVSKLVVMDVICVDGEGPRVQSVCGVQIIEIFLNLQKIVKEPNVALAPFPRRGSKIAGPSFP